MKKFALKATVAAAAALASSLSFAVVDMDGAAGAQGQKVYAKELVATGTSFANTSAAAAGSALTGILDVKTELGFGVATGQTRYIRLDLAGATFNAAPNLWVDRAGVITGPVGTNVSLVSNTTSTYIFQINAQADYAQDDLVEILMPAITATGNTSPTLTYSLFEDAPGAANNLANQRLYTEAVDVYSTKQALVFTPTAGAQTASVNDLYKKFIATPNTVGPVAIGKLTYGVDAAGPLVPSSGAAATLANLISASTLTLTGNFAAASSGTGAISLTAAGNTCGGAGALTAADTLSTSQATFDLYKTASLGINGTLAAEAVAEVCFTADGTTEIAEQIIDAALTVTPVAGSTAASVAKAKIGEIDHDGTTLKFPALSSGKNTTTYLQLVNTSTLNAPLTTKCFLSDGTTVDGLSATVPANTTYRNTLDKVCPTNTSKVQSAVLTMAVPAGSVNGTLMRKESTTGVMTYVNASAGNQ